MTESTNTQIDQEIKTDPSETGGEAPLDFIPLHESPMPKNFEKNNENEKNGQKRIKTEPNDGSSKKPRISMSNVSSSHKGGGDEIVQSSDSEEYYLIVSNLPTDWTYVQIKNYLDQECGHVDEMEMMDRKNLNHSAIRLTFQTSEKCIEVYKKLENKVIKEKKLDVKISDSYTTFPTGVTISTSILDENNDTKTSNEIIPVKNWRPDQDVWDSDPEGLYGLRPQYLKSLNIKPPINKTVHVTNFRCDKHELREVMDLAGNVLMCSVVATVQRYAKVMYSHPLEAVQAISMLNGQMYYGFPLKITMDKTPSDSIILPKGLTNIGLGLGLQGKPIRNIAQQYQRYARKQSSLINPIVFSQIDFNDNNVVKAEENPKDVQKKIKQFMSSVPGCNILNPTVGMRSQYIDDLGSPGVNSKDGSNRSTPETHKTSVGESRKTSVGSISPNQEPQNKNGSGKAQNKNALLGTPALGEAPLNPLVNLGTHSAKGFIHPNLLLNPPVPMHNPLPMPGPGEPYYGPGNNHHLQDAPRQFRPRAPVSFMPLQHPPFGPQPMPPAAFGPAAGMRPQIPPRNYSVPRQVPGNHVTVKFSNLPPSTTFPLLCDQLAQCGQVMSVQLTTPGCAVATFGHPSHAERCFQTFNGMNVEGYVIEVGFI